MAAPAFNADTNASVGDSKTVFQLASDDAIYVPGPCPLCVLKGGFMTCDMSTCKRVHVAAAGTTPPVRCTNEVGSGCLQRCYACSARYGECTDCGEPFGALCTYLDPILVYFRSETEDMRRQEVWSRKFRDTKRERRRARQAAGIVMSEEELRVVESAAQEAEEKEWSADPTYVSNSQYMPLKYVHSFIQEYQTRMDEAREFIAQHSLPATQVGQFNKLWHLARKAKAKSKAAVAAATAASSDSD